MSAICKHPLLVIDGDKQWQVQYDAVISTCVQAKRQEQAFTRMHDDEYTEQRELIADGVRVFITQIDFTDEQISHRIKLCNRIGAGHDEPFRKSFNATFPEQHLDENYVLRDKTGNRVKSNDGGL